MNNKYLVSILAGLVGVGMSVAAWILGSGWWLLLLLPLAGVTWVVQDLMNEIANSYLRSWWEDIGQHGWKLIHDRPGKTIVILIGVAAGITLLIGGGWWIAASYSYGRWIAGAAGVLVALGLGKLAHGTVPSEWRDANNWSTLRVVQLLICTVLAVSSAGGGITALLTTPPGQQQDASAQNPPPSDPPADSTPPKPDHGKKLRDRVGELQKRFGGDWAKTEYTAKMPWTAVPNARQTELLAKAKTRLGELAAMIGGELTGATMEGPVAAEFGYNPEGTLRVVTVWVPLKTPRGMPVDSGRPQGIEMQWWSTESEAQKWAEEIVNAVASLR